jgi:hypothetical protein
MESGDKSVEVTEKIQNNGEHKDVCDTDNEEETFDETVDSDDGGPGVRKGLVMMHRWMKDVSRIDSNADNDNVNGDDCKEEKTKQTEEEPQTDVTDDDGEYSEEEEEMHDGESETSCRFYPLRVGLRSHVSKFSNPVTRPPLKKWKYLAILLYQNKVSVSTGEIQY